MAKADGTTVGSDVPDAYAFAYLRWRTFHDMARMWNLLMFGFTALLLLVFAALAVAIAVDVSEGAALAVIAGITDLGVVRFAVKRRQEALEEEEKASRVVFEYGAPAEEGPGMASDDFGPSTSGRSRGWEPAAPRGW